jgi:cytoskeletal protein CcmA (bactofilin family)
VKKIFKRKIESGKASLASVTSYLSPGTILEGNVRTDGGLCVEGKVLGDVHIGGLLVVNQGGQIEGQVSASHVIIHGAISGNVSALKQIDICATGRVKGNVESEVVTVARGAFLDGFCHTAGAASENNVTPLCHHAPIGHLPLVDRMAKGDN